MPKIKMLRGLPGSGKTTLARELVKKDGNSGRINRDDLRAMLFDSAWSGPREGVVIECEKAIASVLLKHRHTPIIDDTNLTKKHMQLWLQFAAQNGAELKVKRFDTPLSECIRRDFLRPKPIGEAVINRLALNAGLIDFGEKPIAIVDLDGTVCCGLHREHLVSGPDRKDWPAYFALLSEDPPVDIVVRWVRVLAEDHTIVIVSGRPDTYQHETLAWLKTHKVPYDYIFMRPGGTKEPDTQIKKAILDKLPKHLIDLVLDDRPSVCRMWKENGLRVIPVRGAIEEF